MTISSKKFRLQQKIQHGIFVVLLLFLFVLLGYLALETQQQWDISQNGRNTLSQTSIDILQKMKSPIQVTAYATEKHAQYGDVRDIIHNFMQLYQRIKPDLSLTFIDPVEQPRLTKDAGVKVNGEMVIYYQQRRAHLTTINEQAFTQLLMRLARPEERLIMALSGHGERSLDGNANFDLGDFGRQLTVNGFVSQPLNLALTPDIPANTDVLLIASPQVDLMPGEVDKLLHYVDRGGNLLWLVDQESLRGLLALTEKLRLVLTPGVVVDPQAEQLKAPATFALGAIYGQHAITQHFDYITIFPFARQIAFNENDEWKTIPLVDVAPNGWVESGSLDEAITFDESEDIAGPVTIAVALTRQVDHREQRIVVVGSGHFLANSYLGNGNNLDFGINMINWLTGDEDLVSIQPRATMDNQLAFSETALSGMVIVFLFILPGVFLICGVVIWWRRKRSK
ncbi:MAG: GldG family protein [Burkholderiales bacterium]|nr:GldG family protein [Burkholderiales bacterium]